MVPRLAALSLLVAALGCAPRELTARLTQLEQEHAQLVQRTAAAEKRLAEFHAFAADIDAVKAYFKQVSDSLRSMRSDMVRLLDEQHQRVEEGRQEQIRVLRAQERIITQLLPEIARAIQALEKKLPQPNAAIPAPTEPPALPSEAAPPSPAP